MRLLLSAYALLAASLPCISSKASPFTAELQAYSVESLSRQIDLSGSLTHSSSIYTLQKVASSSPVHDSVAPFKIAVDDSIHGNLSWVEASLGKGTRGEKLAVVKGYHDLKKSVFMFPVSGHTAQWTEQRSNHL